MPMTAEELHARATAQLALVKTSEYARKNNQYNEAAYLTQATMKAGISLAQALLETPSGGFAATGASSSLQVQQYTPSTVSSVSTISTVPGAVPTKAWSPHEPHLSYPQSYGK